MREHTALVVVVVLAVAAGACGAASQTDSSKESSTPDSAVARVSAVASAAASDLGSATDSVMRKLGFGAAGDGAKKEVPPTPPAPAEVRRRAAPRPKPAPVAVPAVVDPEPLAIEPSSPAVEEPAEVEEVPEIVPIVDEPLVVEDHSIYTAADLDVVPPILLSRDLSSWRQSRQPYVDLVEVMVSQDGGVERIKLVSEPRRMIDMMALSAAKMWRFDPALKDGEPVRYRLVVPSPSTIYQR
jgi:protein TonB